MSRLAVALALVGTGCVTHLPPVGNRDYLKIQWAESFESAQARANAERKPLVVTLVAGQLDGPC